MRLVPILGTVLSVVFLLFASFIAFVLWSTWPPDDVESIHYDNDDRPRCYYEKNPPLPINQPFKVMSWNVQFMAGKNYTFFFDLLDGTGKDTRPSKEAIATTLDEVARVIDEENPDFVMLQEVDQGAKRTDYEDQLVELLKRKNLNSRYPCHVSAFYWKAKYLPHPKIMGSVGMKLTILSKYNFRLGTRTLLPTFNSNWFVKQFQLKRILLEAIIETDTEERIHLVNTHFEAFAQGTNLMEKQAKRAKAFIDELEGEKKLWIFGGDLNLLLPGERAKMAEAQQAYYVDNTELTPLLSYKHFPEASHLNSAERTKYFTHFPNNPVVTAPDRTIDYLFYSSRFSAKNFRVRQHDTIKISDHFPVIGEFQVKR